MNTNQQALVVPPSAPGAPAGFQDIRGLKPLAEVPGDWVPLLLAWGALVALLLLVLAFLWWRSKQRPAPPPIPVLPPHLLARQQLERALGFLSDPREFCTRVSHAIRVYLEQRFDFHAPERTTEEFLAELRSTHRLTPDQKFSLGEFLQGCDLVKFARFEPDETALRDLHAAAGRLIDETQHEPLEPPPPPPPPAGPPPVPAQVSTPTPAP